MNIAMLVMYGRIFQTISKTIGIISNTVHYLIFLFVIYFMLMCTMSFLAWNVYGDKLPYFRDNSKSLIYFFALFDLKSMYVAQDLIKTNIK